MSSTLLDELCPAIHRYQVRYGEDPTAIGLVMFIQAEDEQNAAIAAAQAQALAERAVLEEEAKAAKVAEEAKLYVRVRFTTYGKLYAYSCPNARLGDWVVVPPNYVTPTPSLLKVVELGRGAFTGVPRPCHKVPRRTATGSDFGVAGTEDTWLTMDRDDCRRYGLNPFTRGMG